VKDEYIYAGKTNLRNRSRPSDVAHDRRRYAPTPHFAAEWLGCGLLSDGGSRHGGSHLEVLVEEADSDSSDESYSSDVPFEAPMEVLGSPSVPCGSAVVTRGRRTDEELA
jgi:hypothetical protein